MINEIDRVAFCGQVLNHFSVFILQFLCLILELFQDSGFPKAPMPAGPHGQLALIRG